MFNKYEEDRLPYPLIEVEGVKGVKEYAIPEGRKKEVLEEEYPFEDVPNLDDIRLDICVDKKFTVREFKIIRRNGMNLLVSPYFFDGGGTVVEWFRVD